MSVEFRKKFKRKKILSFASAAVVAFTMTAAPVFAATDSGNTKDETVYVVTESDGSQSDLIVSDHLKNKSGKDKIEDVSTLTDIENVKGKENSPARMTGAFPGMQRETIFIMRVKRIRKPLFLWISNTILMIKK